MPEVTGSEIAPEAFRQALQAALEKLQRIEWIDCPARINDGLCNEFAREVLAAFGLQWFERTPELRVLSTKWFYGDDDRTLDLDRLRAEGVPVPDDVPVSDRKLSYELGSVHYWVSYRGRHYDSETMDGVDHFLELPFFQRIVERLRGRVHEAQPDALPMMP